MFGNFLYKEGDVWTSVLSSFVSLFIFYILSYLLLKTMGCFSGCLMTSASNQKLFCEVCSAFSYSFDEFVGEKVVSPSYSSAILAPPAGYKFFIRYVFYEDSLLDCGLFCISPYSLFHKTTLHYYFIHLQLILFFSFMDCILGVTTKSLFPMPMS